MEKYNEKHLLEEIIKQWGEFGWHADVYRELLKRSDNSDYTTAKPKLPSLDDVIKNKKFTAGMNYIEQISEIYKTIRKLGNFA